MEFNFNEKLVTRFNVAQVGHREGPEKEGCGLFELNFTSYKKLI
jgi:hypothetical protein